MWIIGGGGGGGGGGCRDEGGKGGGGGGGRGEAEMRGREGGRERGEEGRGEGGRGGRRERGEGVVIMASGVHSGLITGWPDYRGGLIIGVATSQESLYSVLMSVFGIFPDCLVGTSLGS